MNDETPLGKTDNSKLRAGVLIWFFAILLVILNLFAKAIEGARDDPGLQYVTVYAVTGAIVIPIIVVTLFQIGKRFRNLRSRLLIFNWTSLLLLVVAWFGPESADAQGSANSEQSARLEALLQHHPTYVALRDHDPETYNRILGIVQSGRRSGIDAQRVHSRVRNELAQVVETRAPYASDAALLQYMRMTMDQLAAIQAFDPRLCAQHLVLGRSIDMARVLPGDLILRELDVQKRIFESYDPERVKPSDDWAWEPLDTVNAVVYAEHGNNAYDAFSDPSVMESGAPNPCAVTVTLYAEVLQLPAEDAARLSRWLLAD